MLLFNAANETAIEAQITTPPANTAPATGRARTIARRGLLASSKALRATKSFGSASFQLLTRLAIWGSILSIGLRLARSVLTAVAPRGQASRTQLQA